MYLLYIRQIDEFKNMLFSNLQNIFDGEVIQQQTNLEITQLVTDSRNICHRQKNALFFAIKGQNHDGHGYIGELYRQGVRQFVVEKTIDIHTLPEANVILVQKSVKALQAISKCHRKQFTYPVIGITGSNGKTIVKEWLYHLMSPYRHAVKNPKSYNSQLGVPLSIWQMNGRYQLGIFEAGISTTEEMAKLQQIIQPNIGVFTNIGVAHDAGFSDRTQKIAEKLKLFQECEQLIYCKDHEDIHQQVIDSGISTTSWSLTSKAEVTAQLKKQRMDQSKLSVKYQNMLFECTLPFVDNASVENVMHCITTMLYFGHRPDEILVGLKRLPVVKMRLELKLGINNCQIIDDTYNNDLAGLEVALNFLSQHSSLPRTVILSDILQSGISEQELYREVAQLLSSHKVMRFIGVGEKLCAQQSFFPPKNKFFKDTASLISNLNTIDFNKEVILVKGARTYQFEQIVARLTQKTHGTILEINLNAVIHNLNYYRQHLGANTQLMVMVKAMAYGSGSNEIAHLLAHHKVDYFGVAYVDEGVVLRKTGIKTPIMVMNTSPDGFDNLLIHDLEPQIYSFDLLNKFLQFIDNKTVNIHLKIDTGMKRLGFQEEDIQQVIALLKAHSNIQIKSIFSHLSGADEAIHNDFSKQQVNTLYKVYDQISSALNIRPCKHILNSSGILRFPEYHFDMVRLGIGLHGIDNDRQYQNELLQVSTLKTTISQINSVKKGETIGYGRKGKANKNLRIATIAIGYADGFRRAFGNGVGEVIVHGQLASVIGNVCMDMTIINITGINAMVGDEVIVFGEKMPVNVLAKRGNTIPYEILTSVSERVKRVYFQD